MKFQPSILVVDSDPVAGQTLAGVLGRDGLSVHSVGSAAEAVEALAALRYDVILLDLEHIDWARSLDAVRTADPGAELVVATANADDALKAMRAGAADSVFKPYGFDELRLRVARAVERRTLRGNLATYEASQVLHSARGQDAMFGWLSEIAEKVLGADEVGVLTRADSTQVFEVKKGTSFPEAVLRWLADLAASERRGRIWPSASERPLAGGAMSLTSSLALPLVSGDEVLGAIVLLRKPGSPAFSPSELRRASVLAGQLALALDHARLCGELEGRLSESGSTRERLVHVEKLGLANELAASVAHEVNNPLTFVQMNLAELRAMDLRTAASDDVHTLLDETASGVARIAELVSGFGRLAFPSPVKPPVPIQTGELLRAIAERHEAEFRTPERAAAVAFVDPDTLQSGVDAILTFLRKQVSVRKTPIVVEVANLDGRPTVTVWDESLVLTQAERLRMFDPRVDVDTRDGRTMRLDLDLAVAYQAMRANGIDVTVTGSDVRGVQIDLHLPALPDRLSAYAS